MYKIILALLTMAAIPIVLCAQQKQDMNRTQPDHKILVAYFSATGTTAHAAEKLARVTDAMLYAITPVQPYTNADLDWEDKQSRSTIEMNDPTIRPAIGGKEISMADYDVIFLGYPIWWDLAPRIINTFIENYNLKGKTIIPFATSGGSDISNSITALKKNYPDLNWQKGRLLNRSDEKNIQKWIGELGF